jgi:hypothetical protein
MRTRDTKEPPGDGAKACLTDAPTYAERAHPASRSTQEVAARDINIERRARGALRAFALRRGKQLHLEEKRVSVRSKGGAALFAEATGLLKTTV